MKKYIPSAFTAGNLLCGFLAIQLGDYYWSSILLLFSFVFDGLDGLVARALHVTSEFGKQLDSLADVVSFGVAPAYLYYLVAPDDTSIEYKIVPSIIVLAGTLRLATFNVSPSKTYFQGLPIPANALFYIGLLLSFETGSQFFTDVLSFKAAYILIPVVLSILMLSFNVRMFSIKGLTKDWKDNIFHYIMAIISVVLFILFQYEAMAFIVLVYILLSFGYTLFSKNQEKELV